MSEEIKKYSVELSADEIVLLDFALHLSINSLNRVPARVLSRRKANKVILVTQMKELLTRLKDVKL